MLEHATRGLGLQAALLTSVFGLLVSCAPTAPVPTSDDAYVGDYEVRDDLLLVVRREGELLTLLPSFWRTAQILEPLGGDRFRSLLHPRIGFEFRRDDDGAIRSLTVTGHDEIGGDAPRLATGETRPVAALLDCDADRAVDLLVAEGADDPTRAARLGINLMFNFPSRSSCAVDFMDRIARLFPDSPDVHAALGASCVQAGDRARGREAFRRARELDPENRWATFALRHLDPQPDTSEGDDGWTVPFTLDALFAAPTADEIEAVRQDWAGRDLSARGIEEVHRGVLETPHGTFDVRIVSHVVAGNRHYGAILAPAGAAPGSSPVVVDIRGVGWNYPPFEVTPSLRSLQILREDAAGVVIVVPSIRGEVLEFDGRSYTSEGDRTHGWDGGADDTIALLSVALETTPQADGDRVCVYGKSRGGTVALLVGIRDARVDCVVDWAGPTDWFSRMGAVGWTLQELVADGLRERALPGSGMGSSGQFIERHLKPVIDAGTGRLESVRHGMLAASPLFFAEDLPATDVHHGSEDRSVSVANVEALPARWDGVSVPVRRVTVHDGAGHDLPYPAAHDASRAFLRSHLALAPR